MPTIKVLIHPQISRAPATSFTLLSKSRKLESKGSGFFYAHHKSVGSLSNTYEPPQPALLF